MKNEKIKSKRKIVIISVIVLLLLVVLIIFIKNNYKNLKVGNTMINKNIEEIEEYILNISSYDAKIEVTTQSNKNSNKYMLSQQYKAPNIAKQTVQEPKNIEGLETIYDGNKLTINNSKLGASSIYDNYPYMVENFLWLNTFIKEYKEQKECNSAILKEENETVVMEIKAQKEENKYICYKKLYIDKKTCKPIKLLIQDINRKEIVYILYNEITINGLQKEGILAFKQLDNLYSRTLL